MENVEKENIDFYIKNAKPVYQNDLEHIDFNVVQANSLIESKHNLELNEHKIINAVIAQIKQYDKVIDTFEFTFSQLQEICHFEERNIKRTLSRVCDNLMDKKFYINELYIDENNNEDIQRAFYHWIRFIKIRKNKLIIRLSDDLIPLLLNLKKDFTSEKLSAIEEYENEYALRLDMLFTMYFNKKTSKMSVEQTKKYVMRLEFDLEELKTYFFCENKYPRFNSFNERILTPMLNEINNRAFYNVSLEKITENKKVKKLVFFVSLGSRNNRLIVIENKKQTKEKEILTAILEENYNLNKKEIKEIFKNEMNKIKQVLKELKNSQITKEKQKEYILSNLTTKENKFSITEEEKERFLREL